MVELVKKTITGHMRTPIRKANDGQRYARQGRRRQTSSPTTASASSSRPMIRKPVANHQWTNSARGSILRLLQVLEQAGRHQERKRETDENDVERRLGEQPPEALAMGVQHRQAVGLQEPPDDAGQHGQWTDQVDDDGARRPARPRCRDLGCVLSFHSSSRKSASRRSPRAVRAGYPTVVRVHPPGDDASKPSSKTRCQVPRQSCASRNGICSVRGPSKKRTWRSRSGISSGTRRSSKSSRSSKKPVSRSLMRTTPLSSAGET